MDSEELIRILSEEARRFVPERADGFVEAVRQELAFLKLDGPAEQLNDAPRARVPDKYSDRSDEWVVMSMFIIQFLEPVQAAAAIAEYVGDSMSSDEVRGERVVMTSADGIEGEEIDIADLEQLQLARQALEDYAREIGKQALGERFSLSDIAEMDREE